jgi:ABC transporter substrate binding protein
LLAPAAERGHSADSAMCNGCKESRNRRSLAAAAAKLSLVVALSILAAPWASDAQLTKVARVGFLSAGSRSDPATQHNRGAFRQGLRDLGYMESQKGVGDPVGLGVIASLASPRGNVTGLSFGVGMDGKSLELLIEAVRKARRVAILSNPAAPNQALAIRNLTAAARSLDLQLQFLEARSRSDFDGAVPMDQDLALRVEHADVHPSGVRVDATVVSVRRRVEPHPGFLLPSGRGGVVWSRSP